MSKTTKGRTDDEVDNSFNILLLLLYYTFKLPNKLVAIPIKKVMKIRKYLKWKYITKFS